MASKAVITYDDLDQSVRLVPVSDVRRVELVYNSSGEALIRIGHVSCSSATLRAIADLLDSVGVGPR